MYYATVHPVLEEIFWRGYLSRAHRSPVVTDVAFAGYHVVVGLTPPAERAQRRIPRDAAIRQTDWPD